jgi:hypothetical protein
LAKILVTAPTKKIIHPQQETKHAATLANHRTMKSTYLSFTFGLLLLTRVNAFLAPPHSSSFQQQHRRQSSPSFMSSASAPDSTTSTTKSIEDVSQELVQVEQKFVKLLGECSSLKEAEALRRDYLGKKGPVNAAMSYMKELSAEDKPKLGAIVNTVKASLEDKLAAAKETLEEAEMSVILEQDRIDVTMPGLRRTHDIGRRHPLSMTMEKAVDIFVKLGYDTVTDVEDSPEIETDYNCFEALNCPKDHPGKSLYYDVL